MKQVNEEFKSVMNTINSEKFWSLFQIQFLAWDTFKSSLTWKFRFYYLYIFNKFAFCRAFFVFTMHIAFTDCVFFISIHRELRPIQNNPNLEPIKVPGEEEIDVFWKNFGKAEQFRALPKFGKKYTFLKK